MGRNPGSMVWSVSPWQPPGGPETRLFMPGADACKLSILHTSNIFPQSKHLSVFQGHRVIAHHSSSGNHEDLNIQYPKEKNPPPQSASVCKMTSPSHAEIG